MSLARKTSFYSYCNFCLIGDGWQKQFVENGMSGYCMYKIAGEIMFSGQQIEIDKVAAVVYGRNL